MSWPYGQALIEVHDDNLAWVRALLGNPFAPQPSIAP
jgi:hypothetical protein